jgi:LysM repeat protein
MKKRTSIFTRLFAVLALVAAVVAVVLLLSAGLKDDSSDKSGKNANHPSKQATKKPRTKAKTYEIQTGDTLTSIAHKTGVSVAEIQALNPAIDPQILIAGEKLKLK